MGKRNIYTHLPTFLLVLKEDEEEEEDEEVKLYDLDWTVPPETTNTPACADCRWN